MSVSSRKEAKRLQAVVEIRKVHERTPHREGALGASESFAKNLAAKTKTNTTQQTKISTRADKATPYAAEHPTGGGKIASRWSQTTKTALPPRTHLLAGHAVPDAVASQDHETVLGRHLHRQHVRLRRDHLVRRRQARVRLVLEISDGPRQVQVAVHPAGLRRFNVAGCGGGGGAGRDMVQRRREAAKDTGRGVGDKCWAASAVTLGSLTMHLLKDGARSCSRR